MARKVDKRSRALRRNLRKQARKGTLSAREQQDLLNQEARFRKAARQRRPYTLGIPLGVGAGLGAAALLGGDIFSRLGGVKKEGVPSGDPGDVEASQTGAATTSELLRELGAMGQDTPQTNPDAITYDVEEQPVTQVVGGPGVGETASEPASDEAAETAESPEDKTRTEAELLDALTVLEMNPLRDREARPLPRIDASPIDEEGMVRNLVTGPAGIDPLASLGPSAIESAKRLLDYPTYEVPFKELSPKEYRKLSRDEKRAYNDALDEYRFSGPEVRGAFPFRPTQVDAGPSAAEERREALQPELERRRQENAADPALRSAREVASQVDTPNPRRWSYGSPVFREMYPGDERVATGSSADELVRRRDNMVGAKEALRPEEGIGLGGATDYTGGFDVGSATMDPRDGRVAAALGLRPMTDMERVEMLRRGVSANAQRERDAILADQARRAAAAQAAGVSGIPYRQAMGGKNPSTAKLMKRIKAKYGMK